MTTRCVEAGSIYVINYSRKNNMCGIFGISKSNGHSVRAELETMATSLRHRGPDDHGFFESRGRGLGNTRLSIIDVEGGHQPFATKGHQVVLVQNGEIYNHIELRKELEKDGYRFTTSSDTEVLLNLYLRDGVQFVHRLIGMFAIAILDQRTDDLLVFRDRIGIKPVYYREDGGQFMFASEIKSLLRVSSRVTLDYQSLYDFFQLNYVPFDRTIYQEVKPLLAGHYLKLDNSGSLSIHEWWNLIDSVTELDPASTSKEEMQFLLEDAVKLRMRADVPVGSLLSGGLDSSYITAQMVRHNTTTETFSISMVGSDLDESVKFDLVATSLQTRHYKLKMNPEDLHNWSETLFMCDQPHGDTSFIPYWSICSKAAKHVKVALAGDGADEIFGGYGHHMKAWRDDQDTSFSLDTNVPDLNNVFSRDHLNQILRPSFLRNSVDRNTYARLFAYLKGRPESRLELAQWYDTLVLLQSNNLTKPDRMGMGNSLEVRVPYLDHRVVVKALRLPMSDLFRGDTNKFFLRELASYHLPDAIVRAPKQTFSVPVLDWFESVIKPLWTSIGRDKSSHIHELIDFSRLNNSSNAAAPNMRQIRNLCAVYVWMSTHHG